MKTITFWIFSTLVLCVFGADQYTDRYDNINIEEILSNRRLLIPYLKCVLEQGRCTPEGKELRLHIKDGMQNSCVNCTDRQKKGARQVVKHIRAHEQEYWEQLKNKFDPDTKFQESYEKFLAEEDK